MVDNFEVALVKEICPVCGVAHNGPIVMNTLLTEAKAAEVKKMHQQVVGVADQPCESCKEYMKQGVILLTVDESKTTDHRNPWRTGGFIVVSEDWINRAFDEEIAKELTAKRVGYIPHSLAVSIGLLKES